MDTWDNPFSETEEIGLLLETERDARETWKTYNCHILGHRWDRWIDYIFYNDRRVLFENRAHEQIREKERRTTFNARIRRRLFDIQLQHKMKHATNRIDFWWKKTISGGKVEPLTQESLQRLDAAFIYMYIGYAKLQANSHKKRQYLKGTDPVQMAPIKDDFTRLFYRYATYFKRENRMHVLPEPMRDPIRRACS